MNRDGHPARLAAEAVFCHVVGMTRRHADALVQGGEVGFDSGRDLTLKRRAEGTQFVGVGHGRAHRPGADQQCGRYPERVGLDRPDLPGGIGVLAGGGQEGRFTPIHGHGHL